jgi:hypothetical protein
MARIASCINPSLFQASFPVLSLSSHLLLHKCYRTNT